MMGNDGRRIRRGMCWVFRFLGFLFRGKLGSNCCCCCFESEIASLGFGEIEGEFRGGFCFG